MTKTANIAITTDITKANAITHGGVFHADDVISTLILEKLLGNVTVCRTFRVPEDIDDSIIVYDIGYGRFDHHQRGGNGSRENGVPYAAAGLLWKEYGMEILEKAGSLDPEYVWDKVDYSLIQGVDAIDNGAAPRNESNVSIMSLSGAIASFNPTWDSNVSPDDAFMKAVDFARNIFDNILCEAESTAKAKAIGEHAIEKAEGQIMVLDQFIPWDEVIFASENPKATDILFTVFPSNRGGYNWQCVPDALGSFGQRKSVPASWKGLRDAELQAETGVATATFCHPAGFIGGAETLEDAIKLAKLAVTSN